MRTQSRSTRILLVLSLAPVMMWFILISQYGYNVPRKDEWASTVNIGIAAHDGTLSMAELFAPHGEHRILTHKLLVALLTITTDLNLQIEKYITVLLIAGTSLVLFKFFPRQHRDIACLCLLPFNLLLFNIKAEQIFFFAFGDTWAFLVVFVCLTIVLLTKCQLGAGTLLLAGLSGFCATFSMAGGMLIWPIGLIGIVMKKYRDWRYYVIWGALSLIAILSYFHRLNPVSPTERTTDPVKVLKFSLLYLSNPWLSAYRPRFAAAIAILGILIILVAIIVILVATRDWSLLSPWLMLVFFCMGTAALTAYGRYQLDGYIGAFSSRYCIVAALFWCSCLALAAIASRALLESGSQSLLVEGWHVALSVCVVFFLVLYLWTSLQFILVALTPWVIEPGIQHYNCMINYPTTHDISCMEGNTTRNTKIIERKIMALYKRNLVCFSR